MSRTPSDDVTGGGGLGGYRGNPDLRSPALGRSSRDLAADAGPAGASEELFGTGDRESEMLAGHARERAGDDATVTARKFNPDIDPDTRLGLRPTVAPGTAPEPDRSATVSPPAARAIAGAAAGAAGGAVVAVLSYVLFWTGLAGLPTFVAATRGALGSRSPAVGHALGLVAGLALAAAWGALFGLIVRRPNVAQGMLFGLLPTLFGWLVTAPLAGGPMFNGFTAPGLLMPVLFHVLIWGSLVGALVHRWLRAPSSAASPRVL